MGFPFLGSAQGLIRLQSGDGPSGGFYIFSADLYSPQVAPLQFQLFAGPPGTAAGDLTPVGPVLTGTRLSTKGGTNAIAIPGVAAHSTPSLQLRFWDDETGRFASYAEARRRGSSPLVTTVSLSAPGDKLTNTLPFFYAVMEQPILPPTDLPPITTVDSAPGAAVSLVASVPTRDPFQPYFGSVTPLALAGDGSAVLLSETSYGPNEAGPTASLQTWRLGSTAGYLAYSPLFQSVGYSPGPFFPPVLSFIGTTSDCGLILWNRNGAGVNTYNSHNPPVPILGAPEPRWRLPDLQALALSGDGRFVLGSTADGLVQVRLSDFQTVKTYRSVTRWMGASPDGTRVVMRSGEGLLALWLRIEFQGTRPVLQRLNLPPDFEPTLISGDTFVLGTANRLWSDRFGTTNTVAVPPGVDLAYLSGDGSVAAGNTTNGPVLVLLDGSVHPIAEFLPGVTMPAGKIGTAQGLSFDGRTALFTLNSTNIVPNIPFDVLYHARMVVPDLRPAVAASRAGDTIKLRFPTRNGLSYRIEQASDLQTWAEAASWQNGDGADREVALPIRGGSGFTAFFRVAARPSSAH
jgi:hypothetical protein